MTTDTSREAQALRQFADAIEADADPSTTEIASIGIAMSRSIEACLGRMAESVNAEFSSIRDCIEAMKSDVAALRANEIQQTHLPTAGRELDAVVSATEEATNTIMESAETIMAAETNDPESYRAMVEQEVMKIFEACSFQDITGQRISKVVETLQIIEARVGRLASRDGIADARGPLSEAEESRAERRRRLLLEGPAAPGQGMGQDEVDRLLTRAG